MRILVTGGAGFVGSNTSVGLARRHPDWQVVAVDNLHRRGAELNLPRLADAGVEFVRGDVRDPDALRALAKIDALVECSAEPSVLAGLEGGLDYLVHTNLVGAYNCLELARRDDAFFVFLSTSRVYPVAALRALALVETETRFELADGSAGISESFPLEGARTPYGATKLAAELLITEFAGSFGLRAVVDRCGVIAGPWQLGKVDQGVFTHWLLAHRFGRPLEYIGFGGAGKQVRDLLHVEDLVDLIDLQLSSPGEWAGATVNVGGGRACSLSLRETTELCRELTGVDLDVRGSGAERPGDVPLYLSDCSRLYARTDWRPKRDARTILADTLAWIDANADTVEEALLAS
ncbi:MAG TPA: NAD-dependent epimerase/dehydratase family protein [Gaiellaceae bacterium]|nr:NAD-dependent epimerase/dehydratase family protein [Gaiellaceae bacterium]